MELKFREYIADLSWVERAGYVTIYHIETNIKLTRFKIHIDKRRNLNHIIYRIKKVCREDIKKQAEKLIAENQNNEEIIL